MFEPKSISKEAVPAAIERAERYRLLNEPLQAESICIDILAVDPDNRRATVILLLSLTNQFGHRLGENLTRARELLDRFDDEYSRLYYAGIIHERKGTCALERRTPGSGYVAYDDLRSAMECYEKAAECSPPGNDEALLRWNTCARIIEREPDVRPDPGDDHAPMLE